MQKSSNATVEVIVQALNDGNGGRGLGYIFLGNVSVNATDQQSTSSIPSQTPTAAGINSVQVGFAAIITFYFFLMAFNQRLLTRWDERFSFMTSWWDLLTETKVVWVEVILSLSSSHLLHFYISDPSTPSTWVEAENWPLPSSLPSQAFVPSPPHLHVDQVPLQFLSPSSRKDNTHYNLDRCCNLGFRPRYIFLRIFLYYKNAASVFTISIFVRISVSISISISISISTSILRRECGRVV